jgi:hypothetical protein
MNLQNKYSLESQVKSTETIYHISRNSNASQTGKNIF